ncbi:aldehyde dehydrogenase family protein, partial [Chloroflexus sp.]|uniref:aldehyde dehydrogenase family protein n=1 Tax=Chloroflexus sp. TaxID=1904827 RepID=UPI002ADE8C34
MPALLINGQWQAAARGEVFPVHNPATEEVIDYVPRATAADAEQAMTAAEKAFREWRRYTAHDKAHMLHEVAHKMRMHAEELATLLTLEGGKPLVENRDEIGWCAACFDYYAELQRNTRGRVIPSV